VSNKPYERQSLLKEIREELCESAEDLFYAANLCRAAGESAVAAKLAELAELVLKNRQNVGRTS
jgi:hypothetical protein